MDRKDEDSGNMERIYEQLRSAYIQPTLVSQAPSPSESTSTQNDKQSSEISVDIEKGLFALI